MTGVWTTFVTFCSTLLRTAEAHMPDEAQRSALAQRIAAVAALTEEQGTPVVIAFFEQPPAHIAAVNALDHSQFISPLAFPALPPLCLRDLLEAFSRLGPVPYGLVWLALLDVAEAANPVAVQGCLAAGREYIRQQINPSLPVVAMPSPTQLEGMLGTLLGGFPGLQECVNKILQAQEGGGSGEANFNDVVDQVQETLLGPILNNIQSANPAAPNLGPAIRNILEAFRGLNEAIENRGGGDAQAAAMES